MSRMLRLVSMAGGSASKPGGARRIGCAAWRSEDGVPGTADPAFFLLLLVAGGDFLAGQQAVGVGVPFSARVLLAEHCGNILRLVAHAERPICLGQAVQRFRPPAHRKSVVSGKGVS